MTAPTPAGCGKIGYLTRAEAVRALEAFRGRKGGPSLQAYHCPHCGLHHLGRDVKRGPPGRKVGTKAEFMAKLARYRQLANGGD